MKKCVSIIMALIVLFSASVYSGVIPASAKMPVTITASVNAKAHKVKKHKHRHKVPKGNMVRLRPLAVRDEGSNKNCRTVKICRRSKPKQILGTVGRCKWFKSRKALKKHVDKVMNEYNRQYEDVEITWEEYVKRCPYGYEAWSCPCGKWSGNFKYHKG